VHSPTQAASPYALALATDPHGTCWLSARERAEYRTIDDPSRRRDWRASRLAAKRAAARVLGVSDLQCIEVAARSAAAPAIGVRDTVGAPFPTSLGLSLSLSHCEGRGAAAASARGVRLGVDLERAGAVRPSQARYFLTPAERRSTGTRDLAEPWALKEACWKALGCGSCLPFTALELHFDAEGGVRAVTLRGETLEARAAVSYPWPGFVLAVLWIPGDLQ
jgi:phosphopantetheinyl transferase (holo-ACP synthase)